MDMRSPDRPLEHGPEGFQGVHVGIAPRPYFTSMLDRPVIVAQTGKDFVRWPLVGTGARPYRHLSQDRWNEALAGSVGDNLGE